MYRPLLPTLLVLSACGTVDEPSTARTCAGANGWQDTECLTALSEDCRALTTEADCWAADEVPTASVELGCTWTRVAVVQDANTCSLGEVFGRCEAGTYGRAGLGGDQSDGCQQDGTPYPDGFTVFTEESSLVDIRRTPDGSTLPAVNGPWNEPGPATADSYMTTCYNGQDSPAICACAAQACAAMVGI